MLILEKCIGKGATRECYRHPADASKCVKVLIKNTDTSILKRELKYYSLIKSTMNELVVEYDRELVKTNKGLGLVCELLKDDDGKLSKPITFYIKNGKIDKELASEFYYFTYQLIEHELYFYDFNLNNFVVQVKDGKKQLKYIDLKSYENNKSWTFLKLEKIFTPLAERIMRRLKRLYKMLGIEWFQTLNNNSNF